MLEHANNVAQPIATKVEITEHEVTAADGTALPARWYRLPPSDSRAAVLYMHGGGMILGSVPIFDGPVSRYVAPAQEWPCCPSTTGSRPNTASDSGRRRLRRTTLADRPRRRARRGSRRVATVLAGRSDTADRANYPPAPYVIIECKNLTIDPANPHLHQLRGRFSMQRGKVRLLMCRAVLDFDRVMLGCREAFRDGRGTVLPLTDSDLLPLAEQYAKTGDYPLLHDRFRFLTE
jgi:hypothetical protein